MSSPQAVDSARKALQIETFFAESSKTRQRQAAQSALEKRDQAVAELDGGFDTTSSSAQLGRPLSRQEIISRLQRMNKNLVFEQSKFYPDTCGVYVLDPTANLDDLDPANRGRKHVVGMEWGVSPEFTTRKILKDKFGQPQLAGQVRGWRMVLQRLIKERLISLEQAEQAFQISRGRASQKWHQALN